MATASSGRTASRAQWQAISVEFSAGKMARGNVDASILPSYSSTYAFRPVSRRNDFRPAPPGIGPWLAIVPSVASVNSRRKSENNSLGWIPGERFACPMNLSICRQFCGRDFGAAVGSRPRPNRVVHSPFEQAALIRNQLFG